MHKINYFVCVALLLASNSSTAFAALASNETLFESNSQWLRLVHYTVENQSATGYHSEVTVEDFFFSSDGRNDPEAELNATLSAMLKPIGQSADKHAQCRFPARWLWIKRNFPGRTAEAPNVDCKEFKAWRDDNDQSVSLIFATGFLGNPASYFGHILLKFNDADNRDKTELLDVTVNYGAINDDEDDVVTYMIKGVLGGYEGGFSHIEYFYHDHNYGEIENRDLWEYELDLTQSQADFLVAHAWELVGRKFQYFFFSKNCAFRMAELLGVLPGVHLQPKRPWTIPQSVIQILADSEIDGRPLLREVRYRPSRQARFYQRYRALDGQGRDAVHAIVDAGANFSGSIFSTLTPNKKTAVLDTLIDYFQYRWKDDMSANDPVRVSYNRTLAKRFALPPSPATPLINEKQSPHEARRPGLVQLGPAAHGILGPGLSLGFRGAYYDGLDSDAGHVPHSRLSIMDMQLEVYEDEIRLQKLDIAAVDAINGAATGLSGDDLWIWSLRLGLEQQDNACDDGCLTPRAEAYRGLARAVSSYWLTAIYAGVSVQPGLRDEGPVHGYVGSFQDLRLGNGITARAGARLRIAVGGQVNEPWRLSLQARKRLSQNRDLRLEYDYQGASILRLQWGLYW